MNIVEFCKNYSFIFFGLFCTSMIARYLKPFFFEEFVIIKRKIYFNKTMLRNNFFNWFYHKFILIAMFTGSLPVFIISICFSLISILGNLIK